MCEAKAIFTFVAESEDCKEKIISIINENLSDSEMDYVTIEGNKIGIESSNEVDIGSLLGIICTKSPASTVIRVGAEKKYGSMNGASFDVSGSGELSVKDRKGMEGDIENIDHEFIFDGVKPIHPDL